MQYTKVAASRQISNIFCLILILCASICVLIGSVDGRGISAIYNFLNCTLSSYGKSVCNKRLFPNYNIQKKVFFSFTAHQQVQDIYVYISIYRTLVRRHFFLLRKFLLSQSSMPDILSYLVQLIGINTIQEIGVLER